MLSDLSTEELVKKVMQEKNCSFEEAIALLMELTD